MLIHSLKKEDVLRNLVTSEAGLSEEVALRRLKEFGPNEIKEVRKRPLYLRFLSQLTHFLAVLLWIAAILSFISEHLHPGEGMLTMGIAIIAVIFINAIFSFIQEYRAEKALEALKRLLPFYVNVIRDGKERKILAQEVVPGDIILIGEGDKVPADARLIEANFLMVNNASLTGESDAKPRDADAFSGEFLESLNIVFAGTSVLSGSGKAAVFATGMSTEFGRIAHLTSAVEPGLSPLQKEIIKVTRVVAVIAAITGIFFFSIGFIIGRSFWENFLFAVGIIIANVPEGLLPTVTLSLAMGSQRMAKRKALIKTLTSVETLGSVTVICTDKTGTLTQNMMSVTKIAVGLKELNINEMDVADKDIERLMQIAYLCNNAKERDGRIVGDPTEVALYQTSRDVLDRRILSQEPNPIIRLSEIPFDSERKRMTTLNIVNGKRIGLSKGAPESIMPLCSHILVNGIHAPFDKDSLERVSSLYHGFMDMGLRVLAFAYKEVQGDVIENDMVFAGLIGLEDPPRHEVPDAIKRCHEAGIKVIMITGDGSRTAAAIAREIGLIQDMPRIIEGHEFSTLSDAELRDALSAREIIFARMTPKHKMRVVSILKEEGERVAVTGDGVNDAPALKKADIGIAMGITGTDVAKEAADMVLLDDNFATIVNAVEEGRAVFDNIKKFITYIFAHLTPEAVPYILFVLLRIPLPLTVMQILAIDLGTETIPALGLGIEPPEAAIMKHPPRPKDKGLIDRALLLRGYLFLGLVSTAGVLFAYFLVLYKGGWHWGIELPLNDPLVHQATTATFLGIVIMQIGNVFACRTKTESVFRVGIFSNRLILWGILTEIILSAFIIYHPWGNAVFGTAPVDLKIWLILLTFSLGLFVLEELRKAVSRRL